MIYVQTHPNKLKTIEDITRHIFGGNATFTVVSVHRNNKVNDTLRPHYTFKVNRDKNVHTAYKVSMLNGPDNINDFTKEIGYIKDQNGTFKFDGKSLRGDKTLRYKTAIKYIVETMLKTKEIPQWDDGEDKIHIYHAGRCCRCNRTLTVESSIINGVGPECEHYFRSEIANGTKASKEEVKLIKTFDF